MSHEIKEMSKDLVEKKEIVILLIGETGCGKSTFINSLCNYLVHDSMEQAARDIKVVIRSKYHEYDDETGEEKTFSLGEIENNENEDSTESGTQRCKCHVFDQGEYVLKIIDTPGIGDTKGVDSDNRNIQHLLQFIAQYKELNSICILMKPNQTKISPQFKYCLVEMLKFLNKSAANNIVFIFTNCRSTNYKLGDTGKVLNKILTEIRERPPHVNINLTNKDLKYFFDNESFRHLIRVANGSEIESRYLRTYDESWQISTEECERLFKYIVSLEPHQIKDTISLNNVRKCIKLLTRPLVEMKKNIEDNIIACEVHKKDIQEFEGSIKEMAEKLYIPYEELQQCELDYPITVCDDRRCRNLVTVNNVTKTNYKQICHEPCYLDESFDVMGNKILLDCMAFIKIGRHLSDYHWAEKSKFIIDCKFAISDDGKLGWGRTVEVEHSDKCLQCGHSYTTHMHIRYTTQMVSRRLRDEMVYNNITNKEQLKKGQEDLVEQLKRRIENLRAESVELKKYMVRFTSFLAENSITAFNDAFEEYVNYLVAVGIGDPMRLHLSLLEHQTEKEAFQKLLVNETVKEEELSTERINGYIEKLYLLEFSGPMIQRGLVLQRSSIEREHRLMEVQHHLEKKNNKLINWFKGLKSMKKDKHSKGII